MMHPFLTFYSGIIIDREMFHASRWLKDPRFYSPMVVLECGLHIFVRDCVICDPLSCGGSIMEKVNCLVLNFYTKVCNLCGCIIIIHDYCRKELASYMPKLMSC